MKTRIPFDEAYVTWVGKAVYSFSYYERIIIYIVERLAPGFIYEYSREKAMPSGEVSNRFKNALVNYAGGQGVDKKDLGFCSCEFYGLVQRRNALLHAHPITDVDGAQILNYQGMPTKPISDMKWEAVEIESFVGEVDAAACRANELLHGFRA